MLASMATFRYVLCDVFTDQPLAGNALAVFTDGRGLGDERMQAIAAETNLSETTFVFPAEGDGDFRVRIFTPGAELPFAGHPVLGTSVVLARSLPVDRLVLETGAGLIAVDIDRSGGVASAAVMEQPPPQFSEFQDHGPLCSALGVSDRPVVRADNGLHWALVPMSLEELSGLRPDGGSLLSLDGMLGAVCFADLGEVVRVRMFAPSAGVAEDPGTGSAAGPLAAHLGRAVTIHQGVEMGRPCLITADPGDGRPRVGGAVTLVGRGSYVLP
jgi:trans-2,3-dihydro-3-hydroxyanthranilate isomerase